MINFENNSPLENLELFIELTLLDLEEKYKDFITDASWARTTANQ